MYYFVDAVCSVADVLFLHYVACIFFSRRNNSAKALISSYCVFCLALLLLSVNPSLTLIRTAFWIVGGSALIWFVFQAKLLPSFFVSLAFLCVGGLVEIAVMAVMALLGIQNQALIEIGNARMLYIIVTHIVELAVVMVVRLSKSITSGGLSGKVLLPVCPCFAISVLFCLLLGSDISGGNDANPLYLIVALGLLYTSIIIIFYTTRLQEQENIKHNLEIANHHYAMQKDYYEQLHSQQDQIRALWHDIKKYIRAVEAEGNTSGSMEQLQEMVNAIAPVVDVNNRVVSIILNEYMQIAKEAEISITLDVRIPEELAITAADMYIVLGNTLDNALNACHELPEDNRKIQLQLRMHNQMLFYRISNPYVPTHFQRKRSQFHGYGLKNVQECVRRHDGSMVISSDNNTYTVTILLNCCQ